MGMTQTLEKNILVRFWNINEMLLNTDYWYCFLYALDDMQVFAPSMVLERISLENPLSLEESARASLSRVSNHSLI